MDEPLQLLYVDSGVKKVILQSMSSNADVLPSEEILLRHLQTPPKFTVVRVNTVACDNRKVLVDLLRNALLSQYSAKGVSPPTVDIHPDISDAVIVQSNHIPKNLKKDHPTAIVGLQCAVAVLRGSHIYAPGVTALPFGLSVGDKISVYADLQGKCKRGWSKEFDGPKIFVGNGLLVQNRCDLFTVATPRGVAIRMIEPLFDLPSIGDILSEDANRSSGIQKGFLQNLPSLLCAHALAPQMGHTILDLCAAPGGKTTHLAAIVEGKSTVIALDKSAAKIQQIQDNATKLGLKNIQAFVYDSVKAVQKDTTTERLDALSETPPFSPSSFDRICLDVPCSALGQRPQLFVPMKLKEFQSFPRLQRKLFATAVELLKHEGRMVYSTCTYNVEENESVISWALQKFPCLRVVSPNFSMGQPGYLVEGLTADQCRSMRRFGTLSTIDDMPANVNDDTIGFFICCLEKKCH